MIEEYPYILDYGFTPSRPIPPLVSTGSVVGSEGTFNRPGPLSREMKDLLPNGRGATKQPACSMGKIQGRAWDLMKGGRSWEY